MVLKVIKIYLFFLYLSFNMQQHIIEASFNKIINTLDNFHKPSLETAKGKTFDDYNKIMIVIEI